MPPTLLSRHRHLRGVVFFAAVVLHGLSAGAIPITVGFSGTITSISDPSGVLDPGVVVAAPFTGGYTFDPAVANTSPLVTGESLHHLVSPGLTTASIAGAAYSGAFDGILIGDDIGTPVGLRDLWMPWVIVGEDPPVVATVQLRDSTLARLSSEDFFVNESLAGWDAPELRLMRFIPFGPSSYQPQTLAIGTITSLFVVPEPGTALLIAGGLCALAAGRGSRRAHG